MKYCLLLFYGLSVCLACQSNTVEQPSTTPLPVSSQKLVAINVALNMTQPSYEIGLPITLRFVLKNNSTETIQFSTLNSPAHQSVWTNCFRIKDHQGNLIPFIGQVETYNGIAEDKHIEIIESDGIRIYTIDVRTLYQLDKAGTYTIRFIGDDINLLPNSLPAKFTIK